jgi:flagellar basal-body rod modification protein FlgD
MMDISASTFSAVNSTAKERETTQQQSAQNKATLDYDAFLKLLIAQMKFQDPTEPMDPSEHISQLASFSAVEQSIQTNTKLDALLASFALAQADGVIGRTVTSADGEISGKVASVRIVDTGAVAILEDGKEVTLGSGVRIS